MKDVDTNILVRVILADDPVQTPIATQIMAGAVLIPLSVLMETEWVIRKHLTRAIIAATLTDLLDLPGVTTPDEPAIRWAITRYAAGADLADMLHLTQSRRADAFLTFDQALAAEAGAEASVSIEIAT